MYTPKLPKDIRCPLEYGLDLFGGKWKSRILCVLSSGKKLRYSALRNAICNISDAVLSATLKELMASGLVSRRPFEETPPHVEYELTDKGRSVIPILQGICAWAGLYHREGCPDTLPQCRQCDYGWPRGGAGSIAPGDGKRVLQKKEV